jgi:hypothetical protein
VAWSADFLAGPGLTGAATVVVSSAEAARAAEPCFVRVSSYPGLGSALAWDRLLVLGPGQPLERPSDVLVADARLDADEVATALAEL